MRQGYTKDSIGKLQNVTVTLLSTGGFMAVSRGRTILPGMSHVLLEGLLQLLPSRIHLWQVDLVQHNHLVQLATHNVTRKHVTDQR